MAAGRRPEEITLIAVSKTYPPADLLVAAAAGQTLFGENKVQELCAKVEALAGHPQIKIHLIGTLQRNKVKDVVGKTELIHSVHKLSLLQALEKEAEKKTVFRIFFCSLILPVKPASTAFFSKKRRRL